MGTGQWVQWQAGHAGAAYRLNTIQGWQLAGMPRWLQLPGWGLGGWATATGGGAIRYNKVIKRPIKAVTQ